MKIIGVEKNNFTVKETGVVVEGSNVYLSYPVDPAKGKGVAAERIYITDSKAASMSVDLNSMIGKEVIVVYNRYGKVQNIVLAA